MDADKATWPNRRQLARVIPGTDEEIMVEHTALAASRCCICCNGTAVVLLILIFMELQCVSSSLHLTYSCTNVGVHTVVGVFLRSGRALLI